MVYFYSRAKQVVVPRLLRSQTNRNTKLSDDIDLEATQVIVILPSIDQEAGQSAQEILCDPCFLDAINIALSPTAEFKAYVQQLHLFYHAKITTTRAHRKKLHV
jgi:hypothetical protein